MHVLVRCDGIASKVNCERTVAAGWDRTKAGKGLEQRVIKGEEIVEEREKARTGGVE